MTAGVAGSRAATSRTRSHIGWRPHQPRWRHTAPGRRPRPLRSARRGSMISIAHWKSLVSRSRRLHAMSIPVRPTARDASARNTGTIMIKINGFEHVSWAASELEPGQRTLALFGIKPTGSEEIHDQDVTSTYFEGEGGVRFEIIRPLGPQSHLR